MSTEGPAKGGIAAMLLYMICPEDTRQGAHRRIPCVRPATRALLRAVKTGFWFAMAVSLTLALGQLH